MILPVEPAGVYCPGFCAAPSFAESARLTALAVHALKTVENSSRNDIIETCERNAEGFSVAAPVSAPVAEIGLYRDKHADRSPFG